MIPELGMIALIIALSMAVVQATVPLYGALRGRRAMISVARPATYTQGLFVLMAFACLAYSFIVHDFSVLYVANHSNLQLPLIYRFSAVWGAHEGSLLLWVSILCLWSMAVARFSRNMPDNFVALVLAVMGWISVGFLLFMLFTSNPFERLLPAPSDGNDLNPLLQDPGMAIHPPMLYMGYVGFSVAFALAIAALISGKLDAAWARWSRPWTNLAWIFLTLGITLGSWWAYYELGWGGWWFWDPVENASFMPWLVGTALVHSLAVTEKRNAFKAWTVLLATITFSLSLLGTFLVRSGVLTSVHAFASDPTRGVFILIFLCIVVGGALLLFAWRGPILRSVGRFTLVSRESALLFNNVLLVVTAASVLLGTLYPLALEAMGFGKISVGPPYFNSVFIPLTIPLAVLLGIGMLLRWRQDQLQRYRRHALIALLAALVVSVSWVALLLPDLQLRAVVGVALAVWIVSGMVRNLIPIAAQRKKLSAWFRRPLSFYGMNVAHFGVAVFIVGITLTSLYSTEKDVKLSPGEAYTLAGYNFLLEKVERVAGPNYAADQGTVIITRDAEVVAKLYPQKRYYLRQESPMTEAGIDAGLGRDLFVALGEPLDDRGMWSVRLYHKPYLRWIWLGAVFMALGGLLSISDRRYRLREHQTERAAMGAEPQRA